MKILFTGGGTAGHIFPIIAVVREIREIFLRENIQEDFKFYYLGPKDDFAKSLFSQEGIEVKTIRAGKFRRYFGLTSFVQNFVDIFFNIPVSFFQSLFRIFVISPDLIFSKGGYGSFPVVISGWLFLVPVFLHESDVTPGLVNRLMSKFSLEIFVSFPIEKTTYFPSQKMISVGNPIRSSLLEGKKEEAEKILKITGEKPIILVTGGSQGSQRINDVLLAILPEILKNFELIHQVGQRNFNQIEVEANLILSLELRTYYHLVSFLNEDELKHAYAAADLVISRAGSGSIFEISTLGKPSILIPLPESAQNHQVKNAYAYAENGASIVIEEANLTPHFFLEKLRYLLSKPPELKMMSDKARSFSKPLAAKIIAEYIFSYLTQ